MTSIIKKNWFVIAAAFIAAISIGFPEIYLAIDLGEQYKGVPLMGADAEEHYLALIQEVYDGHYALSNTYSAPKDLPYLYGGLGEVFVGLFGKMLRLTAVRINTVMKFISPFILFLLIYYFVFILNPTSLFRKNQNNNSENGRKKIALLSAFFILLGGNLVMRPDELLNLFFGGAYAGVFNNYFRPINPEVSSIFLFIYLILFYKFILRLSESRNYGSRKGIISLTIFLGILLGISFYLYLYTWTFLLTFTFISAALALFQKKKEVLKKILFILCIAFLVSVPYWLNVLKAIAAPEYLDASLRYEMIATHAPIISKTLILLFIILIFLLRRYFSALRKPNEEKKALYFFWIISILSIFAVYNQQIITGKIIQPGHYHVIITVPLIIIFVIGFIWYYFKKISIFKNGFLEKAFIVAAVIILLANNFNWQISSYFRVRERALKNQDYKIALDWLNNNAEKEETIFASRPLSDLIPIFTPLNIYPSAYAQYYLIDGKIFKNQLFLEYRFRGMTPAEADEKFQGDLKREISRRLYGMRYKDNPPEAVIKETAAEYALFYEKDWEEVLKYYPTDYFIFDKKFNELAVADEELYNIFEKVDELDNRFLIYINKFKNQSAK